jgi:hypothetical protein
MKNYYSKGIIGKLVALLWILPLWSLYLLGWIIFEMPEWNGRKRLGPLSPVTVASGANENGFYWTTLLWIIIVLLSFISVVR